MSLTAVLSQKMHIFLFLSWSDQVKIPTMSAYSSRYSMLGLFFAINPGGHTPKFHLPAKKNPKPPFLKLADASV